MIAILILPLLINGLSVLPTVQSSTLELSTGRTQAGPHGCSVTVGRARPLALENGAAVTVDAISIAVNGESVFIAGTPTNVWSSGATIDTRSAASPPSIGVLRGANGVTRLVPTPTGHPDAEHPRVASAGRDGWHVLFVTGKQGGLGGPLQFDRAEVWYARYDGQLWSDTEKLADARFANLLAGRSSDLIIARDGLAYAYSFDNLAAATAGGERKSGLVMLLRRDRSWTADTLSTWEGATSVQLIPRADGEILAAYSQAWFADRRPRSRSLFVAPYEGEWGTPILLLDPTPREVTTIARGGGDHQRVALSWRVGSAESDEDMLEWGVLNARGILERKEPLASVLPFDRAAVLQSGEASTIWFTRKGESRDSVQILVAPSNRVAFALATIGVPLDNYEIVGVAESNGRFLLVSGGVGRTAREPIVSSFVTELGIDCKPTQ